MYSFYGGPQGQSFSFSAIFPNRVALKEDLNQTGFSPVQLNEYVFINYGLQNDDQEYFNTNRDEDNKAYDGHSYNSTLWQKIYTKELVPTEEPNKFYYHNNKYHITDIEYVPNVDPETSEFKYCYICLGVLNGYTPEFQLEPTKTLNPNESPKVGLDNSNTEFPKIQFELPRAAQFHGVDSLEQREDNGDYYFNKKDGQIYNSEGVSLTPYIASFVFNNPTSVGGENGKISFSEDSTVFEKKINVQLPYAKLGVGTVTSGTIAQVNIDNPNSLNPKLSFVLPKGDQGNSGQGLEILPAIVPEKINDIKFIINNDFIITQLPNSILVYQVQPIVFSQLQEDNSYRNFSYWCTYNNGWSILPLAGGGGIARLDWEELGN